MKVTAKTGADICNLEAELNPLEAGLELSKSLRDSLIEQALRAAEEK